MGHGVFPPRTGVTENKGFETARGNSRESLLPFSLGRYRNWYDVSESVGENSGRERARETGKTHAAPLASIGLSGRTDPPGVVSRPAVSAALSALVLGGGVFIPGVRSVGRDTIGSVRFGHGQFQSAVSSRVELSDESGTVRKAGGETRALYCPAGQPPAPARCAGGRAKPRRKSLSEVESAIVRVFLGSAAHPGRLPESTCVYSSITTCERYNFSHFTGSTLAPLSA